MKKQSAINYGIQADKVVANAIAVGPNAQATAPARITKQDAPIAEFADALKQLQLGSLQQQQILNDLEKMKTHNAPERASTMERIVSGVKEAGHLAELITPLKALAAAFGLSLNF